MHINDYSILFSSVAINKTNSTLKDCLSFRPLYSNDEWVFLLIHKLLLIHIVFLVTHLCQERFLFSRKNNAIKSTSWETMKDRYYPKDVNLVIHNGTFQKVADIVICGKGPSKTSSKGVGSSSTVRKMIIKK